jgi:streptogramin lyase
VARVNGDGTMTEFLAGATPGYRVQSRPASIATGPDRNVWFLDEELPVGLQRVNGNGTITFFALPPSLIR